jgi:hypothetical protein
MIQPTFSLIKIKDIQKNCFILENGSLRAVIEVTGVNLSLLSEQEQETLISQFRRLLDGLDFPLEILTISRQENIADYLKTLNLRLNQEDNMLIKFQLEEYIAFLKDYLDNHNIMKKIFYLIVPYDVLDIKFAIFPKNKKEQSLIDQSFESKLQQLEIRANYLQEAISAMGLQSHRLSDIELIELMFEVYNPNLRWQQLPSQVIQKLTEQL